MDGTEKYREYMLLAIEEAKASLQSGNKGFGALIIEAGQVITREHDTEETDQDPTAHAEMKAIKNAARITGKDLRGCIIVSTHEPCPMCAAAIVWANISTLVYGCSIKDSLRSGRRRIDLSCSEVFQRAGADIEVLGGVLKDECEKLYAEDVREHVKKFRGLDEGRIRELENELLQKRLTWLENNRPILEKLTGDDLEKAYQLLCLKLGIEPSEAPVVGKTENRIVFHSRNYCPSLEACRLLGLDTRTICRLIYEKPTEELVKAINPRLRFTRSYDRLRPHADCCEEMFYLEG